MRLHPLLSEDMVLPHLEGRSRDDVLREMADHIRYRKGPAVDEDLFEKLLAREGLGTTAIGRGVAIPHCKVNGLRNPILALGLSPEGIPFRSVDGENAHVIFLVVSPLDHPNVNLRILAAIAKLVRKSGDLARKLLGAPTSQDVLRTLREEEEGLRA
jgi:PTS system nitrogen regulatory IIA component